MCSWWCCANPALLHLQVLSLALTYSVQMQWPDWDLLTQEEVKGRCHCPQPSYQQLCPWNWNWWRSSLIPSIHFQSCLALWKLHLPCRHGEWWLWQPRGVRSCEPTSTSLCQQKHLTQTTLPDHRIYWGTFFILGKGWLIYPQCHAWFKKTFKAKAALVVKLPRI